LSIKLYVGSLPRLLEDKQLQEMFETHGTVVSAKIIRDNLSGRSRGFGFVEMEDLSDAKNAINALNNSELSGRNIIVNEVRSHI
jgi:RNA recognition motif-containing protein